MDKKSKLFDFAIGNPPYNASVDKEGDNKTFAPPVYHEFLDGAFSIADKVEMIHPARFLFRAGRTPKAWNEKMLNDIHFKVLNYEENAAKVFPDTDIKGGVAITYRDSKQNYGCIGTFTTYKELNSIVAKAGCAEPNSSLASIIFIQNKFNLDVLLKEHPEVKSGIGGEGKDPRFEKNIFIKIPLFEEKPSRNSIKTMGIFYNKREWRYIDKRYVDTNHENLNFYKVVIPVASGTGEFGQPLSTPVIQKPGEAYTRSFIGIGAFNNKNEAEAALKYVKTKFVRALLSVLKVTQMNNKDVWEKVPIQDFTPNSDIDWNQSIKNIDRQLYKKYGLNEEEISFIEENVKEMK